jgi:hypothetical protein
MGHVHHWPCKFQAKHRQLILSRQTNPGKINIVRTYGSIWVEFESWTNVTTHACVFRNQGGAKPHKTMRTQPWLSIVPLKCICYGSAAQETQQPWNQRVQLGTHVHVLTTAAYDSDKSKTLMKSAINGNGKLNYKPECNLKTQGCVWKPLTTFPMICLTLCSLQPVRPSKVTWKLLLHVEGRVRFFGHTSSRPDAAIGNRVPKGEQQAQRTSQK